MNWLIAQVGDDAARGFGWCVLGVFVGYMLGHVRGYYVCFNEGKGVRDGRQ